VNIGEGRKEILGGIEDGEVEKVVPRVCQSNIWTIQLKQNIASPKMGYI
jgi:hypothetical protein